jgi:hypothetical protein
MSDPNYFARPDLAQHFAQELFDETLGPSSGLFLAAPRRTGKSTFVRKDLVPALAAMNAEVIYVDLWANKNTDPAVLISDAIRAELRKEDGAIYKAAQKIGLTKFSVGAMGTGLNFDLSQIGLTKDMTLAGVLALLSKENGLPIVLVIDEAQHALTSTDGANAMFALKAARDELNLQGLGLYLVATGSNRNKLAMMVYNREQAFFGASLVDFPKLPPAYLEWLFEKAGVSLDVKRGYDLFTMAGSRPEIINLALRRFKLEVTQGMEGSDARFAALVQENLSEAKAAFLANVAHLPTLQSVLLRELAVDSRQPSTADKSGVYTAKMIQRLQRRILQETQSNEEANKVDPSAIQNALEALREKFFLWKAQRGAYWIEDEQFADWLIEKSDAEPEGSSDDSSPRPHD